MRCQRKTARIIPLLAAFVLGAPAWAAEPHPCATVRYRMPDGVELGPDTSGTAPADLPGSRSGYRLPPRIAFDLALDPIEERFDESRLQLGRVEIDRKTGQSTIDGRPLGDVDCPEAREEQPPAP